MPWVFPLFLQKNKIFKNPKKLFSKKGGLPFFEKTQVFLNPVACFNAMRNMTKLSQ